MKRLEKELEYWLEKNQFKDGAFEGQFGTNTVYEDRRLYHHPNGEDIYITPQMFMTYLGTLCMLNNEKKNAKNIDSILSFLDKAFEKGVVLFPHSDLTSQDLDMFHEEGKYLVSYRHTSIGLSNYLILRKNTKFVNEKIKQLFKDQVQNKDGGWPLSNEVYVNSDLTTSIYFVHLFELFLNLRINPKLNRVIEETQYKTLEYLRKEFESQYRKNFDRMIKTIPSFYFLGFSSFLKYNHPLLYRIPNLIVNELLDDNGWVKVDNPKKIHRYTIRYCNCLFSISFIDTNYYDSYLRTRNNVTRNLNYPELNTFEMFVLLNFIRDKRIITDNLIKVIDFGLPLFNLIPGLGGAIYSYVERFKGDALKNYKKLKKSEPDIV